MEIRFTKEALADRDFWKFNGTEAFRNRISRIIEDISIHPFSGIGKPEPLKFSLQGMWSRRISEEHRIVYSVKDDIITVYSLRYHY